MRILSEDRSTIFDFVSSGAYIKGIYRRFYCNVYFVFTFLGDRKKKKFYVFRRQSDAHVVFYYKYFPAAQNVFRLGRLGIKR